MCWGSVHQRAAMWKQWRDGPGATPLPVQSGEAETGQNGTQPPDPWGGGISPPFLQAWSCCRGQRSALPRGGQTKAALLESDFKKATQATITIEIHSGCNMEENRVGWSVEYRAGWSVEYRLVCSSQSRLVCRVQSRLVCRVQRRDAF